jgi:hypothetical protein
MLDEQLVVRAEAGVMALCRAGGGRVRDHGVWGDTVVIHCWPYALIASIAFLGRVSRCCRSGAGFGNPLGLCTGGLRSAESFAAQDLGWPGPGR